MAANTERLCILILVKSPYHWLAQVLVTSSTIQGNRISQIDSGRRIKTQRERKTSSIKKAREVAGCSRLCYEHVLA